MSLTSQGGARRVLAYLLHLQNGKCVYCDCDIIQNKSGYAKQEKNTATIDHIIPKKLGGSNDRRNLVASCFECNNTKAAKALALEKPIMGNVVRLDMTEVLRELTNTPTKE